MGTIAEAIIPMEARFIPKSVFAATKDLRTSTILNQRTVLILAEVLILPILAKDRALDLAWAPVAVRVQAEVLE